MKINEFGTIGICLDQFGQDKFSGRVYFSLYKEPIVFYSLIGLVNEINRTLEVAGVPQPYMEYRTFDKPYYYAKHSDRKREMEIFHHERFYGKLGTFMVRILYRQSATWQGTVEWVEGEAVMEFRSAMELFILIGSAL